MLLIFSVIYSTLLHRQPLRFHCVGRCWDQTQNSCSFGIGCQTLQPLGQISSTLRQISSTLRFHPLSARSHPHSTRSHPHSADLIHTRLDLIHNSARSHPHSSRSSARSHPHSARFYPHRLDLIHIWLDFIHTRLDFIHTRLDLIHNSARSHPQFGQISSNNLQAQCQTIRQGTVQEYRTALKRAPFKQEHSDTYFRMTTGS